MFPDSFTPPEMTPDVAEEVLAKLSANEPSVGLEAWLRFLRGDVADCRAQDSMFRVDGA